MCYDIKVQIAMAAEEQTPYTVRKTQPAFIRAECKIRVICFCGCFNRVEIASVQT